MGIVVRSESWLGSLSEREKGKESSRICDRLSESDMADILLLLLRPQELLQVRIEKLCLLPE
jgi:hypothetical protein